MLELLKSIKVWKDIGSGKRKFIADLDCRRDLLAKGLSLEDVIERKLVPVHGRGRYIVRGISVNEVETPEFPINLPGSFMVSIPAMIPDVQPYYLMVEHTPYDSAGNPTSMECLGFDDIKLADKFARVLWKNNPLGRPARILLGKILKSYPLNEWHKQANLEDELTTQKAQTNLAKEMLQRTKQDLEKVKRAHDSVQRWREALQEEKEILLRENERLRNREQRELAQGKLLGKSIKVLNLKEPIRMGLISERVFTIGDLVQKTEVDLLRIRGIGRKFLQEVREKLKEHDFSLGMRIKEKEKVETQQKKEDNLGRSVEELELSIRAVRGLQRAKIDTVRDLVQKSEIDLLRTKNFGRKSLKEIKEVLADMGFVLGTQFKLELIPRKEAAKILGCAPATVIRLEHKGLLKRMSETFPAMCDKVEVEALARTKWRKDKQREAV